MYIYLFIYKFSQYVLRLPISFAARKPIDFRRVLKGSITTISNAITRNVLAINIASLSTSTAEANIVTIITTPAQIVHPKICMNFFKPDSYIMLTLYRKIGVNIKVVGEAIKHEIIALTG